MLQKTALEILKSGANVFLTGEPGSGKTHTVNQYVLYLRERGVEPAVTASTGIAATHLGGMTIHSWSGVGIRTRLNSYDLDKIASTEYLVKRIGRAKVLIIDEVSMLSPNMLSLINSVCREVKQNILPFGGLQVIFVGDFFQLPPIVKNEERNNVQTLLKESLPRFAYDSSAWIGAKPFICYLTEQYRQDDQVFLGLLSALRRNEFGSEHLRCLSARKTDQQAMPKNALKLFSHNVDVDKVNDEMLAKLPGETREFFMSSRGPRALVASLQKGCLSPETLGLKIGASVMFTKNNSREGFVNGTVGKVEGFKKDDGNPIVRTRDNRLISAEPMDWTMEEAGRIKASITQLPLRLAWAITVHKSQGMSLDEAVMDLSGVFEYGQGYVALSRLRSLLGLHLLGWNERAFQVHPEVLDRDKTFRLDSSAVAEAFIKMPLAEIDELHKNFIAACDGQEKNNGASVCSINGKKGETHNETLKLWNEGKNLTQIAQTRGLKDSTILSHVEKLATKGKIKRVDYSRLVIDPDFSSELAKIHAAFRELGVEKLSPVFARFGGKYSYDQLRLARMLFVN